LEFLYINGDPLLPLWFDEKAYIGLIDTGSNISLIHTDVFNKLDSEHYTLLPMPATDTAVVANGNEINFSLFIRLNFRLGDENMSVEAYVCPSISFEMILGAHFFAENDLSINFQTKQLEKVLTTCLFVSQPTILPPHTKCIIYTAIAKNTMGQEAIFEPSKSWLELDCLLPRQLVSIDHAKPYIPIEITNFSDVEVALDYRTPLGILSPLLSFQKAIGPLNEDIVTQNSENSNPIMVNEIHKNADSDKSSDTKMSTEEFQTYFDFSKSYLDAGQDRVLLEFLYEYADLFVKKGESLRVTNAMEMDIKLTPEATTLKAKPYRTSPEMRKEINRQIDDMLKADIIENSQGRYTSALFSFGCRL
jgi:hypothetical protein